MESTIVSVSPDIVREGRGRRLRRPSRSPVATGARGRRSSRSADSVKYYDCIAYAPDGSLRIEAHARLADGSDDVYGAVSPDGGTSWSAPVNSRRRSRPPIPASASAMTALAASLSGLE